MLLLFWIFVLFRFCLFDLGLGFVDLRFGVFGLFDFGDFDTMRIWVGMSEFC